MAKNVEYLVGIEGEQQAVGSLEEVAAILGVEKVTKKDITGEGEYADLVTIQEVAARGVDASEEDKQVMFTSIPGEQVTITAEEAKAAFPEFAEGEAGLAELKEAIKDIDTPTLEYLAKAMGAEWEPTYHANIHRMRVAQAVHRVFFPDLFQPKEAKKKKGKYGDLTTEQLMGMAKENKVKWDQSGNEPIDRMRLIMALKASGHLEK